MLFDQNVPREITSPSCKIILTVFKRAQNADVKENSAKKLQILYIELGLWDCEERENTKAMIEKTCIC